MLFTFSSNSQPLLNNTEFILESHAPKRCWAKILHCSDRRVVASIKTSNTGNFQFTGVYKLSKGDSKLGGQVWFKANDYFWLGVETVGDLDFNIDGELFIAFQKKYKTSKINLNFIYFAEISLDNESVGGVGSIVYFSDIFKVGLEYKIGINEIQSQFITLLGFQLDSKIFKKLLKKLDKKNKL